MKQLTNNELKSLLKVLASLIVSLVSDDGNEARATLAINALLEVLKAWIFDDS